MLQPFKKPRTLNLEDVAARLRYDPETGKLFWKRGYGATVKPGDEAGYVDKRGYRFVHIGQKRYSAAALAYLFSYGHWPKLSLRYRSRIDDNRIENIIEYTPEMSQRYNAVKTREYRQRLKDGANLTFPQQPHPAHPEVVFSQTHGVWIAHTSDKAMSLMGHSNTPRRELGRDPDRNKAIDLLLDLEAAALQISLNPRPDLPESAHDTYAGNPTAVSLYDAHLSLFYDSVTGAFYWRTPKTRAGSRADEPEDPKARNSPRGIQISGRWYPAHYMAWFLTYGEWPKRRSIVHHNGNPSDNAIHNIVLRDQKETGE